MRKLATTVGFIVLGGLVAMASVGASADAAGPAIGWEPETLVVEVPPGVTATVTTQLTFTTELDGTFTFDVDKKLDGVVFAPGPTEGVASVGSSGPIPIAVVVPAGADPTDPAVDCSHQGAVKLRYRAAGKTSNGVLPQHLRVCVRIVAAADLPFPTSMADPSPDRIAVNDAGRQYIADELIVGLPFDTADPQQRVGQLADEWGGVVIGATPAARTYQLRFPGVVGFEALGALRDQLVADGVVEFASRQYLTDQAPAVPNDPEWDSWGRGQPGRQQLEPGAHRHAVGLGPHHR